MFYNDAEIIISRRSDYKKLIVIIEKVTGHVLISILNYFK